MDLEAGHRMAHGGVPAPRHPVHRCVQSRLHKRRPPSLQATLGQRFHCTALLRPAGRPAGGLPRGHGPPPPGVRPLRPAAPTSPSARPDSLHSCVAARGSLAPDGGRRGLRRGLVEPGAPGAVGAARQRRRAGASCRSRAQADAPDVADQAGACQVGCGAAVVPRPAPRL